MYSFDFKVINLPKYYRLSDFVEDYNLFDEFILVGFDCFPSSHEVVLKCSDLPLLVKGYYIDSVLQTVLPIHEKYNIHYYVKFSKTPINCPLYFKEFLNNPEEINKYDIFKQIFKISSINK